VCIPSEWQAPVEEMAMKLEQHERTSKRNQAGKTGVLGNVVCKRLNMWVHGIQAAEDAIMAEMAEVKAGMERRHKREKRKKLEQKKKARVRAAQAVLGGSPTFAHLAPFYHLKLIWAYLYLLQRLLLPAALHRSLDMQSAGRTNVY